MEGILTVIIGALSCIFLVGYPQSLVHGRGFLTKREVSIVLSRIENDRKDTEEDQTFQWSKFLRPALDLTVWAYGFIYT